MPGDCRLPPNAIVPIPISVDADIDVVGDGDVDADVDVAERTKDCGRAVGDMSEVVSRDGEIDPIRRHRRVHSQMEPTRERVETETEIESAHRTTTSTNTHTTTTANATNTAANTATTTATATAANKNKKNANHILLSERERSVGKCWGRGTELMMYDGSLKRVEDIVRDSQLGLPQLLMGDDSTSRRVIPESVVTGKGDMYRITSRNDGRTVWTCNADHILVLKVNQKLVLYKKDGRWVIIGYELVNGSDHTAHQPSQHPVHRYLAGSWDDCDHAQAKQVYDEMLKNWRPLEFECTLRDYLTIKSEKIRTACMMFQPAVVNFPPPPRTDRRLASVLALCVGVDGFVSDDLVAETAWVLGMWVANGHGMRPYIARIGCQIPNQSHLPVVDRILRWMRRVLPHESDAEIRARVKTRKSRNLGNVGYAVDCGPVLRRLLLAYDMIGNKHLPLELLTETVAIRKAMLEGIIDGKGQLVKLTMIQLQPQGLRMADGYTHTCCAALAFRSEKSASGTELAKRPAQRPQLGTFISPVRSCLHFFPSRSTSAAVM